MLVLSFHIGCTNTTEPIVLYDFLSASENRQITHSPVCRPVCCHILYLPNTETVNSTPGGKQIIMKANSYKLEKSHRTNKNEVNGDSKSTNVRGPSLVGSLVLPCLYKRFLFILGCYNRSSTKYFFPHISIHLSPSPSRQSCRFTCLLMCVSGTCGLLCKI